MSSVTRCRSQSINDLPFLPSVTVSVSGIVQNNPNTVHIGPSLICSTFDDYNALYETYITPSINILSGGKIYVSRHRHIVAIVNNCLTERVFKFNQVTNPIPINFASLHCTMSQRVQCS